MAKKNKEIEYKLQLTNIKVVQFSQFDLVEPFEIENYPLVEFQTDFGFRNSENENKAISTITVTIAIIETKEIFAKLTCEFYFDVSDLDKLVIKKEGGADINLHLLYTVATITISSVRGILNERLRGSIIQNEIYPLMDVQSLFGNHIK